MRIKENNLNCLLLFRGLAKGNSKAFNFNKQNIFFGNIIGSLV
jgi:hypothetical protein